MTKATRAARQRRLSQRRARLVAAKHLELPFDLARGAIGGEAPLTTAGSPAEVNPVVEAPVAPAVQGSEVAGGVAWSAVGVW